MDSLNQIRELPSSKVIDLSQTYILTQNLASDRKPNLLDDEDIPNIKEKDEETEIRTKYRSNAT